MSKERLTKQDLPFRWLILFLSIAASFGVEYSFDNPAVLKNMMYQYFKNHYSQTDFEIYYSFFYSCLAVPNIIVPFVIGYLVDRVILLLYFLTF
jgi:hypothetical protein